MNITSQAPNSLSRNQMPKEIEELTISLAVQNLNPSMLSAEFLQMTGIVPTDWELAAKPVLNARGSQIAYKNGIKIMAQPGVINFIEGLGAKQVKDLVFAKITLNYIQKMSSAYYQALSISPKIIVPFSGDESAGKNFINQELLKPGSWSNFGEVTPQAALNLFYQLDDHTLAVNINPARLQQPNEVVIPAVLFSGNFTYSLGDSQGKNNIDSLIKKINSWEDNLNSFRLFINEKFLQRAVPQQESLFNN